jgi:hypothetical protein
MKLSVLALLTCTSGLLIADISASDSEHSEETSEHLRSRSFGARNMKSTPAQPSHTSDDGDSAHTVDPSFTQHAQNYWHLYQQNPSLQSFYLQSFYLQSPYQRRLFQCESTSPTALVIYLDNQLQVIYPCAWTIQPSVIYPDPWTPQSIWPWQNPVPQAIFCPFDASSSRPYVQYQEGMPFTRTQERHNRTTDARATHSSPQAQTGDESEQRRSLRKKGNHRGNSRFKRGRK